MTIYRQYLNGRFIYHVRADGRPIYMSASWALREIMRGSRLVALAG